MAALEEVAALVQRESGIHTRDTQYGALAAALKRVDGAGDPAGFMRRAADPVEGPAHVARLLDEVTVQETFFLRTASQLDEIPWERLFARLPETGAKTVRIWSAGCATGEEAYTLALLACEASGRAEPPVRILATDISEEALARARAGNYRPRSTRELPQSLRRRYFREDGDRLIPGERLRSLVTFARHNLVHDPVPPRGEAPFDLILCRNVLIYFDSETVDHVTAALDAALARGGTLMLGSADALCRGAGRLRALATAVAPLVPSTRTGRVLRRPLGRLGEPAGALDPAGVPGAGGAREVISHTTRLLVEDPLNASAHFLHGVAQLEAGDAGAAVVALRRALYAEPRFGLAAFQLGRAQESLGNRPAARRAYEQALRTFDSAGDLYEPLLGQVDLGDVVAAARTRLDALAAIGVGFGGGVAPGR
jgi:chemotaxis protein methyltransferase CheR